MNLALFDFDGTLTRSDTFTPFIYAAVHPTRLAFGRLLLAPWVAAYKLGWLSASAMRARIVAFGFRGRVESEIREAGARYARALPELIRPEVLERVRWHQARGDVVVVVSASLEVYLAPYCAELGVALIGAQLESHQGTLTGRYLAGDCTGVEKAQRVRDRYDLTNYADVFAYGDTEEDRDLLALASHRFFRGQKLMPVAAGEPGSMA